MRRSPSATVLPTRSPDSRPWQPELALWIVLFLLPTLAFKYVYLTELYGSRGGKLRFGLFTVLDSMGDAGGGAARVLRLVRLLSVDVLEVTVAVGVLYAVTRIGLPRLRGWVASGALVAGLVLVGANLVCVRQLGTLLSPETLGIAYHWTKGHPSVLAEFASVSKALFLALALVWASVPIVWRGRALALPFGPLRGRGAEVAILVAVGLAALVGLQARVAMTRGAPKAFGGAWSSMATALRGDADPGPCAHGSPEWPDVERRYRSLVERGARSGEAEVPPAVALDPRHVLVIELETAPRRYYPLADDPRLPTFGRMARNAIVSDRHYTPVPFTKTALYSLVSGTYPRLGKGPAAFGRFASDSMPSVLRRRGYETTFVDSYQIDWRPGLDDRRMWTDLGFDTLLDDGDGAVSHDDASFDDLVQGERRAFGRAGDAILAAERRGRKAFVLVATAIGHFEWKARESDRDLPGAEKIVRIAQVLDGLMAELLGRLEENGLADQVIVVVTGDHGLRYGAEFESLSERPEHGDSEFNVPFLLYAPGKIATTIRPEQVTSHVDVAPTVLSLLGLDVRTLMHHGRDLRSPDLADRITFQWNANLSPVDGLHFRDFHYSLHHLTGAVRVRRDPRAAPEALPALSEEDVETILESAARIFDETACVFLERASAARPASGIVGTLASPRGRSRGGVP